MADDNPFSNNRPGGVANLPGVSGPRNPFSNTRPGGSLNMPSGSRTPIIPNATLETDRTGQGAPSALNAMAGNAARTQLPVASRDSTIPLLYGGPERMAGMIYVATVNATKLYLAQIFCQGEIERIGTNAANDFAGITVNDVTAPGSGIAIHKYLGDAAQASGPVDSWLSSVVTGFDEKLPDTAYIVTETAPSTFTRFPRIVAEVKGRKVYDPRQNLCEYSNEFNSWTAVNTGTAVQDAVGPYGARNYAWTISDTDAANIAYRYLATSIVANNATIEYSIKVAKTTGGTSKTMRLTADMQGGTTIIGNVQLNTDTGATNVSGSAASVSVTDLDTFWLVKFQLTNNNTNTTTVFYVVPAVAAYNSFTESAATTGSCVVCEAQIRNAATPSGYVATVGNTRTNQPTQWSDNPALCLGDFLASSVYGEGRTVDAQSLATAAEYCDQWVGQPPLSCSYTWAANFVTVTSANHGLIAGLNVVIDFTSGGGTPDGNYTVSSVTTDTFTFPLTGSGASGNLTWFTTSFNEKRSRISLVIDTVQPVRAWRDVLRAYVPCWVNVDGNTAYLRVDGPSASDHTFTSANIDSTAGMPTLQRSGVQDTPSVVTIGYTDTSSAPWRLQTAEADGGTSPVRRTRIDMPGIHSRLQALRTAIEKLNHYRLEDLTGEHCVFDEGLKVFPGDRATITDDIGITALEVRILGVQDLGHGRWRLRWRKYDSRVFSGSIVSP